MQRTTKRLVIDLAIWTVSLLTGLTLVAHEAMADGRRFTVDNPQWRSECGSCHVAYPPQLLPAPAWQRVMSGLDRHFGTDASVDAATAAAIGAFLVNNSRPGDTRTLRITETAWFRHEHDEVPAGIWKRPAVKSAANCGACHTRADAGDFSERNIRIPR